MSTQTITSYVVLARKWRPAQFSDIVGQSHIVRTIMNAIRASRVHQAYLLTGSRGIGKTSIARIFAKAVRCENRTWDETTSTLKSCDHCSSCKEIASGNSVDVIEIDGASNNGVDAVREIRENAKFLPAIGSQKIYIIDEVHMLTTAAFNALLKTLEEPPPHVIFIFATTEPHKIPATILSRCQRFDLKRVTVAQIQTRLAEVILSESIHAEAGALALIARAAEGSMRDALSLLDQVIAFSGMNITTESARESVGLIHGQTLLGILKGVLSRKPLEVIELTQQAYQQGHDMRVLTRSLIEFLYASILAKIDAPTPGSLELSDDEWIEIQSLSKLRPIEELELIFQVLHYGMDWIARSPQPKIVLDVLLIKCATAEVLTQISQSSPGTGGGLTQTLAQAAPTASPAPQIQQKNFAPEVKPAAIEVIQKPVSLSPLPTVIAATQPTWEGFIEHVRQTRPLLASFLEHANCEKLPGVAGLMSTDEDILDLTFKPEDSTFKEQIQSRVYTEQLLTLGKDYFKRHMRTRVELKAGGESLAAKRERERDQREQAARQRAQNHPIIAEAKSLFGGELGPIELKDPGGNSS